MLNMSAKLRQNPSSYFQEDLKLENKFPHKNNNKNQERVIELRQVAAKTLSFERILQHNVIPIFASDTLQCVLRISNSNIL